MKEILRDYTIDFDLITGKISSDYLSFFITDKNVSTLFVKLKAINTNDIVAYLKNSEATGHSLDLKVKKPKSGETVNKTGKKIEGQDDEIAIFRFDLETKFTNQAGDCYCELFDTFTENSLEKLVSSEAFPYTVSASVTADATPENPNPGTGGTTSITYDETNELLVFSSVTTENELTTI